MRKPAGPIDEIDRQILAALRDDATLTRAELRARINLTENPLGRRVKRLTQKGFIVGYHTELDYELLGFGVAACVSLKIPFGRERCKAIGDALSRIAEIEWMVWLAGDIDALVFVRARDMRHLEDLVFRVIEACGGDAETKTMTVFSVAFKKPGVAFEGVPC